MEEIRIFKDLIRRKIVDYGRKKFHLKTPMDMTITTLIAYQILPKPLIAIDLFGRHGLWVTADFAPLCDYLEMWEIIPKYAMYAKKFYPKATVNIGDSIQAVRNNKLKRNDYNFIFIDSPAAGIFGDKGNYCEHFDFFPDIFNFMNKKGAILVTNLTHDIAPIIKRYNLPTSYKERWLERRREFFNKKDLMEIIDLEELINIYQNKFSNWGVKTKKIFFIPRNEEVGFLVMVF